jgi:hypothetical protein
MKKNSQINVSSGGGPVFLDKVDNRGGSIKGRSDKHQSGLKPDEAAELFENLFTTITNHSSLSRQDKVDLKIEIEELRQELSKKEKADEGFLLRRLRNIGRMAPDILEVTLAVITNRVVGFGLIAKKIAEKIKSSAR